MLDLDIDSKGLSYLLVDEGADTADKLDVVKVLNQTDITADAFATKEEILGKMIPVGKMLGLGEGKVEHRVFAFREGENIRIDFSNGCSGILLAHGCSGERDGDESEAEDGLSASFASSERTGLRRR